MDGSALHEWTHIRLRVEEGAFPYEKPTARSSE